LFFPETKLYAEALRGLDLAAETFSKATLDNLSSAYRHLRKISEVIERPLLLAEVGERLEAAGRAGIFKPKENDRVTPLAKEPLPNEQEAAQSGFPQINAFSDLTLYFTSEERVQVTVKGRAKALHTYEEMEFQDGRTKNPNTSWKILVFLAGNGGRLKRPSGREVAAFEQHVGKIRQRLRALFRCQDDPLPWDKKAKEYHAAFRVSASDHV
jgi:hypothetical protein